MSRWENLPEEVTFVDRYIVCLHLVLSCLVFIFSCFVLFSSSLVLFSHFVLFCHHLVLCFDALNSSCLVLSSSCLSCLPSSFTLSCLVLLLPCPTLCRPDTENASDIFISFSMDASQIEKVHSLSFVFILVFGHFSSCLALVSVLETRQDKTRPTLHLQCPFCSSKCNEMKEKFSSSTISSDTRAILRFLRARKFDVEQASDMCQKHLDWWCISFPLHCVLVVLVLVLRPGILSECFQILVVPLNLFSCSWLLGLEVLIMVLVSGPGTLCSPPHPSKKKKGRRKREGGLFCEMYDVRPLFLIRPHLFPGAPSFFPSKGAKLSIASRFPPSSVATASVSLSCVYLASLF